MDSTALVDAFLRAELDNLAVERISPANIVVIDNLLVNTLNLRDAYAEILRQHPPGTLGTWGNQDAWQRVILAIIETAAGWSPARVGEDREAVRRVAELSEDIAKGARALARDLRARREHREKHGLTGPADYHPLDVLELAAERSDQAGLYRHWVSRELAPIRMRFDLKYWPRTADFLDALADLQEEPIAPYDELSRAAMSTRQSGSPLEFVRALDKALADLAHFERITMTFSHRMISEIANAALALPEDGLLSQQGVARFRQRNRGRDNID